MIPYARAGEGVNNTDDAPAIATDADAIESINPRRVVPTSLPILSFDREREVLGEDNLGEVTKAEDGERTAKAAHAAEKRLGAMVFFVMMIMMLSQTSNLLLGMRPASGPVRFSASHKSKRVGKSFIFVTCGRTYFAKLDKWDKYLGNKIFGG